MKNILKNSWIFWIAPGFIYLFITCIYPLFNALKMGFYKSVGNTQTFIGLTNYIEIIKDKTFWLVLYNSFYFTFFSVLFHFLVGLGFAVLLNKKMRSRDLYRALQFVPWLFPAVVTSSVWILMYQPQYGLINKIITKVGLGSLIVNWLGNPKFALSSVTLANIWTWYPFFTLMLLAALQNIPEDLYEATKIDGGGEFAQFRYITIPLIRPVILTTCVLDFIWTFRFFDMVWVMTKGGPIRSTEILPTYVYKTAFFEFNFNKAAAIGGIMVIIMIGLSALYLKYYTHNE